MLARKKGQSNQRNSGWDMSMRGRWGVGALLATGVMAYGVLQNGPVWAGPDETPREMTEDLTKALGPDVVSVTAVDQAGNEVLYLRSDVFQQVGLIDYETPVNFPVQPVSRILAVTAIPGSTEGRVLIIYEASPAKALDCKWVGPIYRCYPSS